MNTDQVRIAEPCKVDWKSMTPDEGGRFCGDCKKVVRNLSQMTEREAKKLLRSENDGQLCVRFLYDQNGKIWFGKDAPKADALLPAGMLSRAKRAAAVASMAFATQACGGEVVDSANPSSTKSELAERTERKEERQDEDTDTDEVAEPGGHYEMMGGAPGPSYDNDPQPTPTPNDADGGAPK